MGLSDRIVSALKVSFQGSEDKQPGSVGAPRAPQAPVLSLASDIKDRYGELHILHELSQTILASPNIQTTLSAALKAILATINFDIGNIRLFAVDGKLQQSAFFGYREEQNMQRYLAHAGEGGGGIFVPRIIASRRGFVIEDVMAAEGMRTFKAEGVRTAVLVPITTDNETLGIIAAGSRSVREVPPEKVRLLEAMGAQIGIAVQKARLFDQMQQTAKEQAALSAVTIAASRFLNVRDMLGEALEKILEVTGRERGSIRIKDDLTGRIELAAHRGLSPSETAELARRTGPTVEQAFATGKSVVLNDAAAVRGERSLLSDVAALVSVPIIAAKEVVGVLTVCSRRAMPFEPREVDFLDSIGRVIGVAVQNSRNYLESVRGQEVQKLLKELSQDITTLDLGELFQKITDKVREFFKVDISDIRLLEEEGSRPIVGASGTDAGNIYRLVGIRGRTAWIVEHRRPLVIEDAVIDQSIPTGEALSRLGIRGYAAAPLFGRSGEVIGILRALSFEPRKFSETEADLLQQLANGIAIALENARLFDATRAAYRETQMLHEIAQVVLGGLDLKTMAQRILNKAVELGSFDFGTVLTIDDKWRESIAHFGYLDASAIPRRYEIAGSEHRRRSMTEKGWVVIEDVERAEGVRTLHREGVKSAVLVPIVTDGKILGALQLGSRTPRKFDDRELPLLQGIANLLGIGMQKARLFQKTEQHAQEQATISAIAMATTTSMRVDELLKVVLEKVLEITGRDRASIKLKDLATGRIKLAAHRGITQEYADTIRSHLAPEEKASEIFESGEVVIIDDPEKNLFGLSTHEAGVRSLIWVPLKARGAVIGILNVSTPISKPFSEREIELLKNIGNVVGMALENARLFEETERRGREQAALHAVTATVGSSFDVDQTLVKVLDTVLETTGMDGGYIYLLNGQPPRITLKAHRGMSGAFIDRILRQGVGAKMQRVVATKEPLVVEHIPPDYTGMFRGEQIAAAGWVPIVAKDSVLGILVVCTKQRPDFPRAQMPLLLSIGKALGVALENTRLFHETDRHLRRLQALREIDQAISSTLDLESVLKILLEKIDITLPYASATIRLINRRTGLLEPVACRNLDEAEWKKDKAGRGIPNVVFTTKSPLVIRDVRSDARATDIEFYRKHDLVSYVGVPLIVKDEIIGVLGFYTKQAHDFDSEEINFLATLAGQAAIAIQNSQLYEQARLREAQLQESNRMLSALHAAAAAASQSLELERVLQSVIEKITEIFGFSTTQVHVYDPARDELVLGGYFDPQGETAISVRSFRMGEGIVGRVAATGQAMIFEDVQTDALYGRLSRNKLAGRLGYRFFAVFPIRGKLKNHGTLAFASAQPRRLTVSETRLIEALTDQLAVAIENSQLYDQLKQKLDELQRANKVKAEFLSVMSHELRTPLNVVMGYAGLIREGMLGPTNIEQNRALDKLVSRTHELLSMITSILHATSIEANEVRMESVQFALGELLDELRNAYSAPLGKPVALEWNYARDLPVVSSDRDKILCIFQTLVDNGIKFTENGRVAVSARIVEVREPKNGDRKAVSEKDIWMEFEVADTGIGIPQEKLALIFDKFRQADGSETRRYGGIGLGLYIARSFTRLLGGSIEIDSAPGRGSRFTVKLPFERVARQKAIPSGGTNNICAEAG